MTGPDMALPRDRDQLVKGREFVLAGFNQRSLATQQTHSTTGSLLLLFPFSSLHLPPFL